MEILNITILARIDGKDCLIPVDNESLFLTAMAILQNNKNKEMRAIELPKGLLATCDFHELIKDKTFLEEK